MRRSRLSGVIAGWFTALLILAICGDCGGSPELLPITTGDGGWEHVYNLPQGVLINELSFVDNKTGWAVGYGGLILKTTNGGVTWSPQGFEVPDVDLRSVCFSDASNGCAVGFRLSSEDEGMILRTTDGGVTWKQAKLPEKLNLSSICFSDAETGWAVGTSGPIIRQPRNKACKLMKTTDGGATWEVVSNVPMEFFLQKVLFLDDQHGWVWEPNRWNSIVRTVDGGKTWIKPKSVPKGSYIKSVCFVDADNGWACGLGRDGRLMLHTTDGGDTWDKQNKGLPLNNKPPYHCLDSVCFIDESNGWACGTSGTVVRTADGGATWSASQVGNTDQTLSSIHFADGNNGWAAGQFGAILRTTDGGKTWIAPRTATLRGLLAVDFANKTTGWMTGCGEGDYLGGVILKSTDGGMSWVEQRPNTGDWINNLCAVDERHCWAVGDNGTALTTDDGGQTWVKKTSWLNGLSDVRTGICRAQFIDDKFGWMLVGDISDPSNSQYSIRRTTDGGKTWETVSTGTVAVVNDMCFVDRRTGWEVGAKGVVMKTTDGARTWKRKYTGTVKHLGGVGFVDDRVGWIVGQEGLVMRTTDGGETWASKDLGTQEDLSEVRFLDSSMGWIGGSRHLLMTTDGGKTWTKQDVGSGISGGGARFIDRDRGWIPGLRTTTGGLPGCVWAKKQPDGKHAEFGHLVVTKTLPDGLYAVHPDSKIGMKLRTKDAQAKVGDYVYVYGKIASDGAEKIIDADSVGIVTAGWGVVKEDKNDTQARSY